ncbi:hypothetical protein B0H16DRAFT_461545 [Mycena metata]|uniref:Uncharacterized protein n=1 Tax=Mycena metata TaxID=1033252 RepID=A0AAD7MG70_9AGAR|nr:hypothetical protein B0H16DRAFT_461545 [Mycena metata]
MLLNTLLENNGPVLARTFAEAILMPTMSYLLQTRDSKILQASLSLLEHLAATKDADVRPLFDAYTCSCLMKLHPTTQVRQNSMRILGYLGYLINNRIEMDNASSGIWRCVVAYLPLVDLLSLCAVNRAFFAVFGVIRAERQFQSLHFAKYENPLMKYVRESTLVSEVRVQPWDVQPKPKSKYKSPSWLTNLPHTHVYDVSEWEEDDEITRRVKKQTLRVADTIKGFANLHTYHIDWDEGPYHPKFFPALLHLIIPAVGQRLSTLTLKIPLQYMPSLPHLARSLTQLENLALTIHTGAHITSYISDKMEGLVVFMNSLIRELRSLTISTTPTSTYLDLEPLFRHLGRGRRLTAFTLCIPFDGGHLADPTSLRRFIINHCYTLESLTLGTTRPTIRPVASARASKTKFWIRDTMKNHPHFPALSRLSLGLRPLRTDLTPLLQGLRAKRAQLRVLKLSERPLEHAELVRVLEALDYPPHLCVLSLRLRCLSPEAVDTLAAGLPALSALELTFAEVVHQEAASDTSSTVSQDSYGLSRESELTLFCQKMEGKFYPHWSLARLAIPEGPQVRWLDAMERLFIRCIPTLQSFEELVLCV